jgi:hypothetical protein
LARQGLVAFRTLFDPQLEPTIGKVHYGSAHLRALGCQMGGKDRVIKRWVDGNIEKRMGS